MIYDLIAHFYVRANDKEPRFRVPLGTVVAGNPSYFEKHGFVEASAMNGYADYVKNVSQAELLQWLKPDYDVAELTTVLGLVPYERIELAAFELEFITDDGNLPPVGLQINNTSVIFTGNIPWNPVIFQDGDKDFAVPLKFLLRRFGVHTMFEVISSLRVFSTRDNWTFDQLQEYFNTNLDDVISYASEKLLGKRDKYGNPMIHAVINLCSQSIPELDKIVGTLCLVPTNANQLKVEGFSARIIELWEATAPAGKTTLQEQIEDLIAADNRNAIWIRMATLRAQLSLRPQRNDKEGRAMKEALKRLETYMEDLKCEN